MIVAQFGALPSSLVRPEKPGGIQAARPNRIPSGPHVAVGPFTFPVNVNEYSYKASYNKLVSTAEGRDLMQDILQEVNRLSKDTLHVYGTAVGEMAGGKCSAEHATTSNGVAFVPAVPRCKDRKKADGRVWHSIRIPEDHIWDYRYLTDDPKLLVDGLHQLPVYRFEHPVKLEPWGVYISINEYGNYKFTVKKVVKYPSWLASLWNSFWNGLKDLVAKIIEFYGDIFDILKAAACSMAQPYLTDLNKISNQNYAGMDLVATNAKFSAIGISPTQLSSLAAGGLEVQAAMAIGQEVAARFCKPSGSGGGGGFPWSSYPKGSVARLNTTRNVWSVYAPTTTTGLGDAYASGAGLGGDPVEPPVPGGTTKVGEEPATAPKPTGDPVKDGGTEVDKPIYKRAWFWALIIGGGAATAGGIYWWRKRKTPPQLKSAWM
jgi:hypothetical protein